jgi:uncharacterized protein YecT (DUF1311 family)
MACHLLPAKVMKYFFPPLKCFAVTVLAFGACDSGSPSKTQDDIAADSALAADLALANRDTLLIDSIGQYRPAEGAIADTSAGAVAKAEAGPVAPPSSATGATVPVTTGEAPSRPGVVQSSPRPGTGSSGASATEPPSSRAPVRRTSRSACSSPVLADQQACVHTLLATTDMRLNRIYRALITEMRREEGIRPGQKDPPSVERLRVAQRAWVVYRDNECRRRGRGKEGALWARPRVRCLGAFSVRRANELADSFSRLTAR